MSTHSDGCNDCDPSTVCDDALRAEVWRRHGHLITNPANIVLPREQVERDLRVLEAVERVCGELTSDFSSRCPECLCSKQAGRHLAGCELAASIADHRKALGPKEEPEAPKPKLTCENGYHYYGIGGFCQDCGRSKGRVRRA